MKLIVNEKDGCCISIHIEYTPTEALIINQAMRRYVDDKKVNEENRKAMKQMLDVEPIFREIAAESAVLDKIRDEIEALPRELPTDARNMVRRTRVLDIIDRHMKGADK